MRKGFSRFHAPLKSHDSYALRAITGERESRASDSSGFQLDIFARIFQSMTRSSIREWILRCVIIETFSPVRSKPFHLWSFLFLTINCLVRWFEYSNKTHTIVNWVIFYKYRIIDEDNLVSISNSLFFTFNSDY